MVDQREGHHYMNNDNGGEDDSEGLLGFHAYLNSLTASFNSNQQQGGRDENFIEVKGPLGLKLKKTPSFVCLIEQKLSEANKNKRKRNEGSQNPSSSSKAKMDNFASQSMSEKLSEKLKASNFPALALKIGSWERLSSHEGDLTAKCYYAKRKFVWEVLEGALKSKIEMQWSDIAGIRAVIRDNENGLLEIELNQPPAYFSEIDPQPRKHTLWKVSFDFTGGQAPICRRHSAIFPPGYLDKHYEKLLQCCNQVLANNQGLANNLAKRDNEIGMSNFGFPGKDYCVTNPNIGIQHTHTESLPYYELLSHSLKQPQPSHSLAYNEQPQMYPYKEQPQLLHSLVYKEQPELLPELAYKEQPQLSHLLAYREQPQLYPYKEQPQLSPELPYKEQPQLYPYEKQPQLYLYKEQPQLSPELSYKEQPQLYPYKEQLQLSPELPYKEQPQLSHSLTYKEHPQLYPYKEPPQPYPYKEPPQTSPELPYKEQPQLSPELPYKELSQLSPHLSPELPDLSPELPLQQQYENSHLDTIINEANMPPQNMVINPWYREPSMEDLAILDAMQDICPWI
ncbi:hypothetical protein LguiB_021538 [Lonicera macranthoides]